MSGNKLTIKQQKFINQYIKTGHITQSALDAGYSPVSAHSIGSENLKKPEIQAKIGKIMSEEAAKLGITIEYVLGNIKNIAERDTNEPSSVVLKANELLGKHLKIFHDGEMDVTLKEHRDTLRQLEELE